MQDSLATTGLLVALIPAWLLVAAASLTALCAVYLLVLAIAARVYRKPLLDLEGEHPTLVVVVPAHNEEELVERCVRSLLAQDYPSGKFEVVVVADNCTDRTAERAQNAGARVLVRLDAAHRGKGAALRWAFDRLLSASGRADAAVVVDADSEADPGLLRGLAARYRGGAEVVQGEYLASRGEGTHKEELREAAFLLFHRVRFSGRAALGLPCTLVGNGMLFSRAVLDRHPWSAFSSVEDLEYSLDLRLAGIKTVFAVGAIVRGPVSASGPGAATQRLRWEGGRIHVVRTHLPRLMKAMVQRPRRWVLDAVVDLIVPPLGVLAILASAGAVASVIAVGLHVLPAAAMVPGLVGPGAIGAFVIVGLWAGAAPASAYRALAAAPLLVAADLAVRFRLIGGTHADKWVRTPREPAHPSASVKRWTRARRFAVAGVPIDPLTMDEALEFLRFAIRTGRKMQLCTVNLDFLRNSCRDPDVRSVLQNSHLNLADGAPVVWLGKLLGSAVPGRVAGSDLVPRLMGIAAEEGARVFLLGGEEEVAREAARRLVEAHPDLVIAGIYSPPRQALVEMDHEGIVRRINEAGTDVLLVALGHPKQDKWVALNREELRAGVAMGVGCTFDLIAGRRRRAPRWMGATGLEWLFRFLHEPRRLGSRYALDAWYLLFVLLPDVAWGRWRSRRSAPIRVLGESLQPYRLPVRSAAQYASDKREPLEQVAR